MYQEKNNVYQVSTTLTEKWVKHKMHKQEYALYLSVDEVQACQFELGVTVFLFRLEHPADIIDECTV